MADSLQELRFQRNLVEESAPCSCVADSELSFHNAEPLPGRICITADHYDRTRPHVLLFANDLVHAFVQVVSESVLRVFEQAIALTGLARRHRGWQINEPFWIGGKSAHNLQRGDRVLFANCDGSV